jgi:Zn-dependent oligopeptidase
MVRGGPAPPCVTPSGPRFATSETTRRLVDEARLARCPENEARLLELVRVRAEAAAALGYPSHAAFVLEENMAGTPLAVDTFLTDLAVKLRPHVRLFVWGGLLRPSATNICGGRRSPG